jgi:uncharacterized protein YjbI with pentapeptide repeats
MQAKNSEREVKFGRLVQSNVLFQLDNTISKVTDISKSVSSYINLDKYRKEVLQMLLKIKQDIYIKKATNEEGSGKLTEKILQGIRSVNEYAEQMETRIGNLRVVHKTKTCKNVGEEFKFSHDTLSGKDNNIAFTDNDKSAQQSNHLRNCLWLNTVQGIPTDCENEVKWTIRISTSEGKNLKDMLMGVGLDTFKPSGSDVTKGFWGFSGTDTFNNGTSSDKFDNFFIENCDYTFTLKPEPMLDSKRNFTLKIRQTLSPFSTHDIVFELDSDITFIYPTVRFNSKGDKYTFIDAAALKAAGFTAAALKAEGFDAAQLKDAGFTAAALKAEGFNAAQLKDAGFTAAALKVADFTAAQLKDAGFKLGELVDAKFTAYKLKDADFNVTDLKAVGFTLGELVDAKFTAAQLKDADFNVTDLKAVGFTLRELVNAKFTAAQLKDAKVTPAQLKDANVTAAQLKDAGFTAAELKDAGFELADLKREGKGRFNATDFINAGYSPGQLLRAGFNAANLKAAGITVQQLWGDKVINIGSKELKEAGFSAEELKTGGVKSNLNVTTRRTRLRLKKSRVITRRPKSSHLHHVSNASVGSTRKKLKGKKQITNGSGKAISTRKI